MCQLSVHRDPFLVSSRTGCDAPTSAHAIVGRVCRDLERTVSGVDRSPQDLAIRWDEERSTTRARSRTLVIKKLERASVRRSAPNETAQSEDIFWPLPAPMGVWKTPWQHCICLPELPSPRKGKFAPYRVDSARTITVGGHSMSDPWVPGFHG